MKSARQLRTTDLHRLDWRPGSLLAVSHIEIDEMVPSWGILEPGMKTTIG